MRFFDSHCHLDATAFDEDRAQVWVRARAAGVQGAIIPGTHPDQWKSLASLCKHFAGVGYAVGLHPWWIVPQRHTPEDLTRQLRAAAPGALAIGETGIDRTERGLHVPDELQAKIFAAHLQIAQERDLPVICHVVRAHTAALEVLRSYRGQIQGVVHSFAGSAEVAKQYLDLGLHISFSGSALRFGPKRMKAIEAIPDERILIETDAPDQSPTGEVRNEPAALANVAAWIASTRGVSVETLSHVTTSNTQRLFRLPTAAL